MSKLVGIRRVERSLDAARTSAYTILLSVMLSGVMMAAGAVILRPAANMYSGPTEDSDVVSQAIYGTNVEVLEENNAWARIRTPDKYTGWIPKASIVKSSRPYASEGKVAEVSSLFANLYREADITKHQPVVTVPFETRLEVVAEPEKENRRWLQVRLPDDRSGWLQRGDITFDPKKLTIPELIEFSKRFLGLPYLWGGVSTFGYDCSGLTQMLCRRRGVLMPRDADQQAAWSGVEPVEKNRLQPGDLLYFGPSEKKITHTGMYIGNGEFINATAHEHPVTRICKLDDPHWKKLFVAARRLK